ncbi:unnamed protein product [Linum tenue]|uniref:Uncharacterized protein n=1 Tax=Linum tenue TaxID=586396 RepID=A0AAV0KY70_9ROSI|nr:unnamed protein product [Linum tenue]
MRAQQTSFWSQKMSCGRTIL